MSRITTKGETFMAAPPLLTMEGITKTFPGVRALEHVDLRVESGEIHALIGKNGAGKSTLIRILGGVYQPDEGRILIGGHAKAQILTILDRLATEGVGIIFISSELEKVVAVSHRILTMSRGRIVGEMESHKASIQEIILSATRI